MVNSYKCSRHALYTPEIQISVKLCMFKLALHVRKLCSQVVYPKIFTIIVIDATTQGYFCTLLTCYYQYLLPAFCGFTHFLICIVIVIPQSGCVKSATLCITIPHLQQPALRRQGGCGASDCRSCMLGLGVRRGATVIVCRSFQFNFSFKYIKEHN